MPSHSSSTVLDDDGIARAAADWIVRLSADDASERDDARAGFEAWKCADPRHAAAAAGMERFVDQARALRGDGLDGAAGDGHAPSTQAARAALRAALDSPSRRAEVAARPRRVAVSLVLAFALIVPAMLTLHAFPPSEMMADLRTGTGQQSMHVLADDTRLRLGTGSAVNTKLTPNLRHVELLTGEILVDVAKDASRPFVVETAHGRIRALGTRFIVRRDAGSTTLTMLESKTAVTTGEPAGVEIPVAAGQQVRLSAQGVERLDTVDASLVEDAFVHRRLLVRGRPLSEVLDELSRHRTGVIRYEREQIESIRVSAVLPLDDTDRALQLLADNFPQLRVRTFTPWLVLVDSTR